MVDYPANFDSRTSNNLSVHMCKCAYLEGSTSIGQLYM